MSARSKRWRWVRRVLLALVLVAIVLRLILPSAIGWSAKSWAEARGLDLVIGDIELSLIGGRVHLWQLTVARDGETVLSLDSIDVDVETSALLHGDLVVRRAVIDGLEASLERSADGSFALLDSLSKTEDDASKTTREPSEPSAPFAIESLQVPIRIDAVRVQRLRVAWRDFAVSPPVDLIAQLDLALDNLGHPEREAKLTARFSAPGAVGLLSFDASLTSSRESASLRAEVLATEIEGDSVTAYLTAIGVQAPERSQQLRLAIESDVELVGPNRISGAAKLVQSLGQPVGSSTSWFELAEVGARFVPSDEGTDIELAVEGLTLEAERASDGRFVVAGFTLGAADEAADGADEAQSSAQQPAPVERESGAAETRPAPLRLSQARVSSVRIALVDRAVAEEPVELEFELTRFDVDLPKTGAARLDLDFAVPGVLERGRVGFDVEFGAQRGTGRVELDGLTGERVAPYLVGSGIEPSGESSALSLDVEFDGSNERFDASIVGLSLTSGPATPFAIERIVATQVHAGGAASVRIDGAVLHAVSEVDGATTIGALRVLPTEALAVPHTETAPIRVSLDASLTGFDLASGALAPLTVVMAAPGFVDRVAIDGTLAVTKTSAAVRLDCEVEGLRTDSLSTLRPDTVETGRSGALRLELDVEPHVSGGHELQLRALDVDLDGRLTVAELGATGHIRAESSTVELEARGIDAAELELSDGRLAFAIEALQTKSGSRIELSDFVFGDGVSSLVLPLAVIDVPRSDAEVIEIARVAVEGLSVDVRRDGDGRIKVAGIALSREPSTDTTAALPAPVDAATPATAPQATTPAGTWPRIELGEFDVELERVALIDEADGSEARASMRLASAAPWTVFDPAGSSGALELRLDAAIAPGLGALSCDLLIAPDPGGVMVTALVEATGIDDSGLVAVWPELGEAIVGGGFVDGRFGARVSVRLDAPRTGPTEFDLRRATGGTIEIDDVVLVPTIDAEPTFAVRELRATLGPLGAPGTPLRFLDVEMHDVRAIVEQQETGLVVAGLTLRPAPVEEVGAQAGAAPAASTPASTALIPAPTAASTPAGTPAGTPPSPTGGVIIERLIWTGLDLVYADHTAEPPTLLPIDALELDMRHLAIGTVGRRAMQFRLSVGGADVELPDLPREGPLLAKLARELTGGTERTQSSRPWLDELVVSGQLQPGPTAQGWVRTELYGFELTALRAMAESAGVKIGAGVVDGNLRLDLRGDRGVRVGSRTTFTSLSISEPANGPISSFLALPAPLDVVLWVLENERSEHVIPLAFSIDRSGVSSADLIAAGSKALVILIADAIASSPLRVGTGLLDMVGLDVIGDEIFSGDLFGLNVFNRRSEGPADGTIVLVPFQSGATALDAEGSRAITEVLRLLSANETTTVRIQHRYSLDDLERAVELALPAPAESLRLALGVEEERGALVAEAALERERLARLIATGAVEEARERTAALRALSLRIVGLEASLDTLYELAIEPDERTRTKRLREAGLRLAERRFEAFVRDLSARGTQKSLARIQLVRPRLADVGEEGEGAALVVTVRAR